MCINIARNSDNQMKFIGAEHNEKKYYFQHSLSILKLIKII